MERGDKDLKPGTDKGLDTLESCKKSFDCKLNGHCSIHEGWCVVAKDADCKDTTICKLEGRCWAVGSPPWKVDCKAKSQDDCKKAQDCSDSGRCTFKSGRCIASTKEECKKSKFCRLDKKCTLKKGMCVK